MSERRSPRTGIDRRNLQEFFRDSLHAALRHQELEVEEHTEHYVVNMLTMFARSEALFETDGERSRMKPLALILAEAAEAASDEQRERSLQRLGDVSLFTAGFFAYGFARRLVDVDYHIAMGGRAYGTLALTGSRSTRARALATVFAELSHKFHQLVDALNEVSDMSRLHTDEDVLRLYEIWLRTGSRRAHGLLQQLGVDPAAVPVVSGAH